MMFNVKRFRKLFLTAALCLGATFALTGCGGEQPSAEPVDKTLKIGSSVNFDPFEFPSEKDGEYLGFDIDLIQAIGKELGRETEIQNINFEELITALDDKKIDAAISAMTITDERKAKADFSDPYFTAGMSIVVKRDNREINSFDDLAGKRIAVQKGTIAAEKAKQVPNAEVTEFDTVLACLRTLNAGTSDAVINDKPVNDYVILRDSIPDLRTLPEQLDVGDYGIAVAKGNDRLLKDINRALKKLKESGEYDQIHDRWFGSVHQ